MSVSTCVTKEDPGCCSSSISHSKIQPQQLEAPATYEMSTVNNISESNRTISAKNASAGRYAKSDNELSGSSIPMSDNPLTLRPPPPGRHLHRYAHHHDIGNIRQQYQGHLQNNYPKSGDASNMHSRTYFYFQSGNPNTLNARFLEWTAPAYHAPVALESPFVSLHHSTPILYPGLQFHQQRNQCSS